MRAFTLAILLAGGLLPVPAPADADQRMARAAQQFAGLERSRGLVIAIDGEPVIETVFSGPSLDQPVNVKSLAKTFMAALAGAAIERGIVAGVDQPVIEPLGPRVPERAPAGIEEVTIGNLLSMQSGLQRTSGANYGAWVNSRDWVQDALARPFVDEPGGRMLYSTGNSHILSGLLTQASGRSTLALARDLLADPMDIHLPAWQTDPQGVYFGGNNMLLSPHALIRLGELYRNDGMVDGKRILPEGWVETSWQPRGQSQFHDDHYGYGWFIRELSGEPAYYGWGFGGQVLYVVPSLRLTVALTSDPEPPASGSSYLARIHAIMADHVIPAVRAHSGAS